MSRALTRAEKVHTLPIRVGTLFRPIVTYAPLTVLRQTLKALRKRETRKS